MQTLIVHRFRGALVGAALGEVLGGEFQRSPQADLSLLCRAPQGGDGRSSGDLSVEGWGHRVYAAAQQWIEREWYGQPAADRAVPITTHATGHLWSVVPLALYYHHDRARLHDALEQHSQQHRLASLGAGVEESCALLAQAIALGCQSSLRDERPWPDLLHTLRLQDDSPLNVALHDLCRLRQAGQGMAGIESWFKQSISTHRGAEARSPSSDLLLGYWVAIALYSVLSTPQFPQLALMRLRQFSGVSPLLGLLTGMLAGVYNGINHFPRDWRLQLQVSSPLQHQIRQRWGVTVDDLVHLGDRLFAAWAGADPGTDPSLDLPLVVSAPVSPRFHSVPS